MNFRLVLESGHSKKNTTSIIDEVGCSSEKFAKLMQVFSDGPELISQRAA